MRKITFILSLVLLFCLTQKNYAQLENANWYFGLQAGLDFNDGTQAPTALTNSSMNTEGASASISDSSGNLLFYTNGINVWNSNHQIMTNGSDLFGNEEVNQSVIIVPDPGNTSKFYILTNEGDAMGLSGLYYSVVDMSLNSGLGDIDILQKNELLLEYSAKNLTAILNPNDNTYWVVVFGYANDSSRNDTFYSFKVDGLGINTPVESTFTFTLPESEENIAYGGQMKISPDALSLALINNTVDDNLDLAQSLFVYNFDNVTGSVSLLDDSISLDNTDNFSSYGLEFSPDSNLLYVTTTYNLSERLQVGSLYQIDYKNTMNPPVLIHEDFDPIYALQLAIDGKIYAVNSSGELGVINTPNIPGTGADYIHEAINLGMVNIAIKELPQLVSEIVLAEDTKKAKKFIIMGNPFKEELKFKFKFIQTYTIEFYNSSGVLSKTEVYDDMTNRKIYKVNTSDLTTDTYYLIVRDEQSQIWYETVLKID